MKYHPSDSTPFTRTIRALTLLISISDVSLQLFADPLGAAFTYQGRLTDGGQPADGSYELKFSLYDALSNGSQIGNSLTNVGVRFTSGDIASADQTVTWVPGAGSWGFSSDRKLKAEFTSVDQRGVLDKVSRLPITEWNYAGYSQRHIGRMAQDFHVLLPLNESATTLNDADLHAVALAAIQGLNQKAENGRQKAGHRMARLEAEDADLKQRLETLERLLLRKENQ